MIRPFDSHEWSYTNTCSDIWDGEGRKFDDSFVTQSWWDVERWWCERRKSSSRQFRRSGEVTHTISWSVSADSVYTMWQAHFLTLIWSFMPLLLWLVMLIYFSGTPASSCYDFLLNIACDSISCLVLYVYSTFQRCLLGSVLYTPEGFIVFPAEWIACQLVSSSRAKPFGHKYKYKCLILNNVCLSTAGYN